MPARFGARAVHPRPGCAEHDPEKVWWADFPASAEPPCRFSVASPPRWPLSQSARSPLPWSRLTQGRALRPAILYGIDTRATREIAELEPPRAPALIPSRPPKVLWIRRNEPEVWARTRRIVNGSGFFTLRLTGEATIDIYDATIFAPFFDATAAWSTEMLRWWRRWS